MCATKKTEGYAREKNILYTYMMSKILRKMGKEKRIAGKKKIGWGKAK